MLTAEIELKLLELPVVDYDRHNWSRLLDPNRTHLPPVLLEGTGLSSEYDDHGY